MLAPLAGAALKRFLPMAVPYIGLAVAAFFLWQLLEDRNNLKVEVKTLTQTVENLQKTQSVHTITVVRDKTRAMQDAVELEAMKEYIDDLTEHFEQQAQERAAADEEPRYCFSSDDTERLLDLWK